MEVRDREYEGYIALLKKELVPAMGCTEPIAIAFAAAKANCILNDTVKQVDIFASGNIIKNVKSVVVPNTQGSKGIESAAAIGIVAGNPDKNLQVISCVSEEQIRLFKAFVDRVPIHVHHLKSRCALDIQVRLTGVKHSAMVCIQNEHSNIVRMEKDDVCIMECASKEKERELLESIHFSMKGIYEFAKIAQIEDVQAILKRQVDYNWAIAQEGLKHSYGANIGSVLLATYGDSIQIRARALAAAGSDARMSGCELPVVINSGSGNQGMSASIPVIAYAKEYNVCDDTLYRALLISNLSTLYQKKFIGRLSAYCGAVSAGAGAGAGIAYVLGGDYDHICHTIVNTLAITSGMICDGAKPSCAAKIATAVDAGIMGCMMYQKGKQFYKGEGIVCCDIEKTIMGVGQIARDGMRSTDDEIIKMMIHN